jgi:hypothetical protein
MMKTKEGHRMNKKPNDASSPNGKVKFEVADVFRIYGQEYRLNNPLPYRIFQAQCRITA